MKRVCIIGGGIIGLMTAYFARKAGCEVTVLEQTDLTDGCSFGNAGMIVPSHIIPLAAPGMIAKGFKMLLNPTSPFYIKPRLSGSLLRWGYYFYKSSTADHVRRSIPALRDISLLSHNLYTDLAHELDCSFGFEQKGLLMLYKTAAVEHEEQKTAEIANQAGIEARVLSHSELREVEPEVELDVRGGVYYPGDAHLNPNELMKNLVRHLTNNGVTLATQTTANDFEHSGNRIRAVITDKGRYEADEIVVATGAWSPFTAAKLGIMLPMQSGKGYSFSVPNAAPKIHIPSILAEGKVAVTPMGNMVRFGGTMEITNIDFSVNLQRVRGIAQTIPQFYRGMNIETPTPERLWSGLRPCSPDGLPFIGKSKRWQNVIIATGHAMMGLSLAPATGLLVTELITNTPLHMDMVPFQPERF